MKKREILASYYSQVELHSAELALKHGIENGTIRLNGSEISGDTYRARLAIKNYFEAKWDSCKKCWLVVKNQDFANLIFKEGLTVSN